MEEYYHSLDNIKHKRPRTLLSRLWRYIVRIGIAISVLFNVITGGPSNQTFSARNHGWRIKGKANICSIIDFIFFFDSDHCRMSWIYWRTRKDVVHECNQGNNNDTVSKGL